MTNKVAAWYVAIVVGVILCVVGWMHIRTLADKRLCHDVLAMPLQGDSYMQFKTLIDALDHAGSETWRDGNDPMTFTDYKAALQRAKRLLLQAVEEGDVRAFSLIYSHVDYNVTDQAFLDDSPYVQLIRLETQDAFEREALGALLNAAKRPNQSGSIYELAAEAYAKGLIIVPDYQKALRYYEEAWMASDTESTAYMTGIYRTLGDGANAYLWALRARASAARGPDPESNFAMDEVERAIKAMDVCPDDIIAIQKMAADPNVLKVPANLACPAAAPLQLPPLPPRAAN